MEFTSWWLPSQTSSKQVNNKSDSHNFHGEKGAERQGMSQEYGSHFIYDYEGMKVSLMWDNWPVLKAGREKSCRYLVPEQREKSKQRHESGGGPSIAREEEGRVGHIGFHGSMSECWTLLRVKGKPVESTCRAGEWWYKLCNLHF